MDMPLEQFRHRFRLMYGSGYLPRSFSAGSDNGVCAVWSKLGIASAEPPKMAFRSGVLFSANNWPGLLQQDIQLLPAETLPGRDELCNQWLAQSQETLAKNPSDVPAKFFRMKANFYLGNLEESLLEIEDLLKPPRTRAKRR